MEVGTAYKEEEEGVQSGVRTKLRTGIRGLIIIFPDHPQTWNVKLTRFLVDELGSSVAFRVLLVGEAGTTYKVHLSKTISAKPKDLMSRRVREDAQTHVPTTWRVLLFNNDLRRHLAKNLGVSGDYISDAGEGRKLFGSPSPKRKASKRSDKKERTPKDSTKKIAYTPSSTISTPEMPSPPTTSKSDDTRRDISGADDNQREAAKSNDTGRDVPKADDKRRETAKCDDTRRDVPSGDDNQKEAIKPDEGLDIHGSDDRKDAATEDSTTLPPDVACISASIQPAATLVQTAPSNVGPSATEEVAACDVPESTAVQREAPKSTALGQEAAPGAEPQQPSLFADVMHETAIGQFKDPMAYQMECPMTPLVPLQTT